MNADRAHRVPEAVADEHEFTYGFEQKAMARKMVAPHGAFTAGIHQLAAKGSCENAVAVYAHDSSLSIANMTLCVVNYE